MRFKAVVTILGLSLVGLGGLSSSTALAADTYAFDAVLSLTGDCSTSAVDPVPDPPLPDCKAGAHPPSGEFINPRGMAVDTHGNRYVSSYGKSSAQGSEGRIDVFDDSGLFLTEILVPAGPRAIAVDSEGNLYVWESNFTISPRLSRYEPETYLPESGEIKYSGARVTVAEAELPFNAGMAVNPLNDHLFVDYETRIAEFSSAKEGNELLDSSMGSGVLYASRWIAIDASNGRLYASDSEPSLKRSRVRVFEVAKPHALLETIEGPSAEDPFLTEAGHLVVAADEEAGHFFVGDLAAGPVVYAFDEDYEHVTTIEHSFQDAGPSALAVDNGSSSPRRGYLFVSSGFNSKGHSYAFEPVDEPDAPEVESVSVGLIGETSAELRATINPNGAQTHYVFQYVTRQAFEEEGFASPLIAGEGDVPAGGEGVAVASPVTGLVPGVAYRARVIVENECAPAGCGDEAETGFRTYPEREDLPSCPNEDLRPGLSSLLPDCRAYELVTPADTNGRAPRGIGFESAQFQTLAASPLGDKVSFLTEGGAIPGTGGTGAFNGDRYLATRGSEGWVTASAGPNGTESEAPSPGSVSADQGFSFWETGGSDAGTAVVNGTTTTYVRYPDGHSELIGRGALATDPQVQGNLIAPGGTHIVFTSTTDSPSTSVQLEEDAPPAGTAAVYDRTEDEVTHVVSLLPGDITPAAGEGASYAGASPDGEGIAFRIGNTLFLRYRNAETFEIGENVTVAGVTQGGKRIFYVEDGDLYAFDVESEEAIQFTGSGDIVVVNVASGGAAAYFVSPSVLAGGPNPHGAMPVAGEQNLYLSREGEISFVGTVTDRDVEGEVRADGLSGGLGLWVTAVVKGQVAKDPSRTTPDGDVLLFESRADLDGSDPSGHVQIYRYDATAGDLRCLSCNPTGMASTDASLQSIAPITNSPAPASSSGFVPNLRPDGRRAFFQSSEPLVLHDTNGVQDVYEWEEEGVGSCGRSGGCVYLISSGHSARDNFLYGVSESGDDVFFTTSALLTASDADGTVSIYDARVNGGFPEGRPSCPLSADCPGQGVSAPPLPNLGTEGAGPSGNVPPPKRCAKGKRKVKRAGRVRCVKKHHKRRHHRPGAEGKKGGK
ncbi:MAG: hypothetical protein M3335_02575 [Actinomycetota bacterium]|nr:hypothetical protein [Actinomycetota bacterium]